MFSVPPSVAPAVLSPPAGAFSPATQPLKRSAAVAVAATSAMRPAREVVKRRRMGMRWSLLWIGARWGGAGWGLPGQYGKCGMDGSR